MTPPDQLSWIIGRNGSCPHLAAQARREADIELPNSYRVEVWSLEAQRKQQLITDGKVQAGFTQSWDPRYAG